MPRFQREDIQKLYDLPLMDLLFRAQSVHREHHDPNKVQWSTLLSVKTGGCPEDCGYCAQASRFQTDLEREPLMPLPEVVSAARAAREGGSTRFCMGAAWRRVGDKDMPALEAMVREVKSLGLETCMTLGTVTPEQAQQLCDAGLDYYNHNLDTSREHYGNVISTRGYDERLGTLAAVRDAGMKVCSGGILGLGEDRSDRVGLLLELANLDVPPESVPINELVPVAGTPLAENVEPVDWTELVRTIATARICMPTSEIRLSAGRENLEESLQAMCFLAGANSIFTGDKLLTTPNRRFDDDKRLLDKLGMEPTQGVDSVAETVRAACGSAPVSVPEMSTDVPQVADSGF